MIQFSDINNGSREAYTYFVSFVIRDTDTDKALYRISTVVSRKGVPITHDELLDSVIDSTSRKLDLAISFQYGRIYIDLVAFNALPS